MRFNGGKLLVCGLLSLAAAVVAVDVGDEHKVALYDYFLHAPYLGEFPVRPRGILGNAQNLNSHKRVWNEQQVNITALGLDVEHTDSRWLQLKGIGTLAEV